VNKFPAFASQFALTNEEEQVLPARIGQPKEVENVTLKNTPTFLLDLPWAKKKIHVKHQNKI